MQSKISNNCIYYILIQYLYKIQDPNKLMEEEQSPIVNKDRDHQSSPQNKIKEQPKQNSNNMELEEEDISSMSISFEEDQFNRIYTNQLKKKDQEVKQSDGMEKENAQIQRQHYAGKFIQNQKSKSERRQRGRRRSRSRSSSKQGQALQERERSRSREKKKHCSWHIYEVCQQIEINTERFPLMIRTLPIFKKKEQILHQIIHNQVLLITGQTGCGKSTQVPRLLYQYIRSKNLPHRIICVQPRRLAVKNLHNILSRQIPQHGAVGYHISMQSFVNDNTKILFMTNGIFLQRLIHSTAFFEEYPFIILDEVHERDIDTDFILLAIKRIIRQHPRVRIILMSATIDNKLFQYYFAEDEIQNFMKRQNYYKKYIRLQQQYEMDRSALKLQFEHDANNGDNFDIQIQHVGKQQQLVKKVQMQYLKSQSPCPSINVTDKNKYTKKYFYLDTIHNFIHGNFNMRWGTIYFSHKYPATHRELYETACVLLDEILQRSMVVNNKGFSNVDNDSKNTSVLIFLPGLAQIQYLVSDISTYFGKRATTAFEIVKCHSSILNDEVMRNLHAPVYDKCKVIIATNIAESSITVPGVKYVIDFCLSKEINFDQKSRMQNLDLVWASKASCEQRAGRTGRVCDGIVIRMLEKGFYDKIKQYSTPQIQRSSLDRLILRIKLIHENQKGNIFEDPGEVLGTALQPPNLKNIDQAIKSLIFCGGLKIIDNKIILTEMGRVYVDIPLDIIYSKMLIFSLLMGNYDDILILVCILSQNKNAFKKMAIEKNPIEFFDIISNEERCDFYALVNAFKAKRENLRKGQRYNRIQLDTYYQSVQLMDDISRRISKKKFIERMPYKIEINSEAEHRQKFKLTIAYGFLSQLMRVRGMIYDQKQEKRAKMMKKQNIPIHNTIILLNSDVIRKSPDHNFQADNRLKKTWVQNLAYSFRINPADISITLGFGLSFLHCKKQTDLNKILFVKHMQKKKASQDTRKSASTMHLTLSQILPHLGDLDYMEEGTVSEYHKQQCVSIDNFSSNRIISSANQYSSNSEFSGCRLLITNSIMQQSNRLSCRYSSLLPDISHLDVLLHLIFHPFINLLPDQKMTRYQSVYIRKRCKIKIQYQLEDQEIYEANEIRAIIRELMNMQLFQEIVEEPSQIKGKIADLKEGAIQDQNNQKQKEINQIKDVENIMPVFNQPQQISLNNVIGNQQGNCLEKNQSAMEEQEKICEQRLRILKQQKIAKIESFWPKLKKFITKDRQPIMGEEKWQQIYFHQMKIDNKFTLNKTSKGEDRQYMNEIMTLSLKSSYFSSHFASEIPLQKRVSDYVAWKNQKYASVKAIQEKVLCHDPYATCQECGIKIAKLNKIGPITNHYYRELFEHIQENVIKLPYNQLGDYFCSMLMSVYTDKQYDVFGCKNGHYLMIKFRDEKRMKILTFSTISILYADGQIQAEPDFQNFEVRYWKEKADRAKDRKLKKMQQNYCFVCNQTTNSMKQLENHIRNQYHESNMKQFAMNIKKNKSKKPQAKIPSDQQIMYY